MSDLPDTHERAEAEPKLVRWAVPILGATFAAALLVTFMGASTSTPWEEDYRAAAGLSGSELTEARLTNSQISRNNWDVTLRLAFGIGATGGALVGLGRFELARSEQRRADRQLRLAQDQFQQSEHQFLARQELDREVQKREANRHQLAAERDAARQMAERFVAAIGLLASREDAAVIGGLYTLEGIFRESADYHQRVVDVACAYVRGFSARTKPDSDQGAGASPTSPVPEALRAALDVLMRCTECELGMSVDLSGAQLQGVRLAGAHLEQAHLDGAHLAGAHLAGAHLEQAHLDGAGLQNANLHEAILIETHLEWANLTGAHLEGAHLFGAHLQGASLFGASLFGAHLQGASLVGAHLERAQLGGIIYNEETVWPEGFTPPPSTHPPPPSATGERGLWA